MLQGWHYAGVGDVERRHRVRECQPIHVTRRERSRAASGVEERGHPNERKATTSGASPSRGPLRPVKQQVGPAQGPSEKTINKNPCLLYLGKPHLSYLKPYFFYRVLHKESCLFYRAFKKTKGTCIYVFILLFDLHIFLKKN